MNRRISEFPPKVTAIAELVRQSQYVVEADTLRGDDLDSGELEEEKDYLYKLVLQVQRIRGRRGSSTLTLWGSIFVTGELLRWFGIKWVMPRIVKETLFSWARKRRRRRCSACEVAPLAPIWTVWREEIGDLLMEKRKILYT
ncbi:hypothetical protein HAX54_041298 [Datura stramonium]|uniref:Uncharacterized protein n=1 Tax=Datura stramonium TaxID=4076 RepID=A0ABS8SL42_DATST|nr:hypothetical protein [Datura stramonium]